MKRIMLTAVTAVLSVALCLTASCSKKETAEKTALSPEQAKQMETMKKSFEHAKKVVVAKVNGAPILMSDLVEYMNAMTARYLKPGQRPTPEIGEKIKHEALTFLIFRELAIQEAVKQGMNPEPADVAAALKQVRARFGSDADYNRYLSANAMTQADLKKSIERELRYEMITAKEIHEKLGSVDVSEKKMKDIYNHNKAHFMMPERFTAVDVHFTSGKDDAQTRKEADSVLAALKKSGNDMSKVTGNISMRQIMVTKERLPKIFAALSHLKPGAVSGVIAEADGLHIVKMVKKEAAGEISFDKAKPLIHQELMMQAYQARQKAWDLQLKKNAKIEIVGVKEMESGIMPAD